MSKRFCLSLVIAGENRILNQPIVVTIQFNIGSAIGIRMPFTAFKRFFKEKETIETEILRYIGQPYIVFSKEGKCVRRHSKVTEILLDLGFGENELRYRDSLIASLKNQELKEYDASAQQILNEQLMLDHHSGFSGIAEMEGTFIFAQVRDTEKGSYALFKDVTTDYMLLQAGNKLSFSTHTMLGLLENLPIGVLISDARAQGAPILCSNKSFLEVTKTSLNDLIDKPIIETLTQYFHQDDLKDSLSILMSGLNEFSLEVEKKDQGFHYWYRLRGRPVLNEENIPILFVITVEDLTEVKLRQVQSAQSYRMEMLGQLASGVAHDYNNILSVIDGYARMLKKEVSDRHTLCHQLDYIIDSVKKGASLSHQILRYGQASDNKSEIFNLSDLILNLNPLFKPLLSENINLNLDIEENLFVQCVPDQMTQVLMNLIVNARDAMEEQGGGLNISLKESNETVVLSS